jgi:type IV pilus assembly protein PilA
MKDTKNKRLNNGGFSLVELIIVIAIMAVLVGVLAPQYLKYVEKSRQSADISTIDEMVSAVEIYSADPNAAIVDGTLTCTNGTIVASGTAGSDGTYPAGTAAAALQAAGIGVTQTVKSAAYQNWTITFNANSVVFSGTNGTALQTALGR